MNLEQFKPIGQIAVSAMLAEMRETSGIPFSLIWVRATDKSRIKPKGQIIFKAQCLYGSSTRETTEKATRADGSERQNANFKEDGTLPIHDYETNSFHTPLIASIMFYNGKKVNH